MGRRPELKAREAALVALIETGNAKAAAHRLGITPMAVRRRIAAYCAHYGYESPVQAAYYLGRPEIHDHFEQISG